MDILANLEKGVERLLAAHAGLAEQVKKLEQENLALRKGRGTDSALDERVAELEAERARLRERLEKLVVQLDALESES